MIEMINVIRFTVVYLGGGGLLYLAVCFVLKIMQYSDRKFKNGRHAPISFAV